MEAFLNAYQNLPAAISPVAFSIGSFELRWYSLGYIFAFIVAGEVTRWRIRRRETQLPLVPNDVYDAYIYMLIGVILGGRLGYLLFLRF